MTIKKFFKYCFFILISAWLLNFALFAASMHFKFSSVNIYHDEKNTAVIVLTGGHNRITEGFKVFSHGHIKDMFITGVYNGVTIEELIKTSKFKGTLPECCITLGHKATTTIENAQEVKEWLEGKDIHRLVLITSDYHMPRAMFEFKTAMPEMTLIPYTMAQQDYAPKDLKYWKLIAEEYHKLLYRRLVIKIEKIMK